MSDITPDPDALETAHELTSALDGMTGQLKAVQRELQAMNDRLERAEERQDRADKLAKRIRHLIIGLIISLVLDVTLTIVVTVFAFQAHSASAQASATIAQLHATQIAACQIGNGTLAKEVVLWEHIYALSLATSKPTPAQLKTDTQLLAFIRQTFRARNCAVIYRLR